MSLHADATSVLRAWEAPDVAQEALRQRYLAHLAAHPDAMTRGCRPAHLTASTIILDSDGARVLLTLHVKARRWFQVGGHVEPDDQGLAQAARREALEESGLPADELDLDPSPLLLDAHHVPFCAGGVDHFDVTFVARAAPGARPRISEESLDLAWWPVDDLPNPELAPFVARALAR